MDTDQIAAFLAIVLLMGVAVAYNWLVNGDLYKRLWQHFTSHRK